MTARNVSNTFKRAVFSQQTREVFVVLITLSNENLTDDIRVASDPYELLPIAGKRGVVSRGDEYIYLPFTLSLPADDDTGVARAQISIDNVSREIISSVRSTSGKIGCKIEVVLASDPDTVEVVMDDFLLDTVSYDALTVQGTISVEFFDLEPFSRSRFTPAEFPGMF